MSERLLCVGENVAHLRQQCLRLVREFSMRFIMHCQNTSAPGSLSPPLMCLSVAKVFRIQRAFDLSTIRQTCLTSIAVDRTDIIYLISSPFLYSNILFPLTLPLCQPFLHESKLTSFWSDGTSQTEAVSFFLLNSLSYLCVPSLMCPYSMINTRHNINMKITI